MIAIDTNVLLYAHRTDHPEHEPALAALEDLVRSGRRCAVPWPCVHEFLAVATHPRVFAPPTPLDAALDWLDALLTQPQVLTIAESSRHFQVLAELARAARLSGPRVHDARIAAICLGHGVTELWTVDRDFTLFPALRTRNPLVG